MKDEATQEPIKSLGEIGLENFATYLMNRIMGRYNAVLRENLGKAGLSTPKMRALAVLTVVDAPLIGELAVYAIVENSTLSRALDALENDGLVRRVTDEADSRATRVMITEMGRSIFADLWPEMHAACEAMFVGIDAEERDAFIGTLKKMHRNIRIHDY